MASMIRNTYTAVIARGEWWEGAVQTEPYEAAWAGEAVFFVHVMEVKGQNIAPSPGSARPPEGVQSSLGRPGGPLGAATAKVQISPDGMRWVDEGAALTITPQADSLSFARVSNFGGWLRLSVTVPAALGIKVVATLALKA